VQPSPFGLLLLSQPENSTQELTWNFQVTLTGHWFYSMCEEKEIECKHNNKHARLLHYLPLKVEAGLNFIPFFNLLLLMFISFILSSNVRRHGF
jgi:hypothetical protein